MNKDKKRTTRRDRMGNPTASMIVPGSSSIADVHLAFAGYLFHPTNACLNAVIGTQCRSILFTGIGYELTVWRSTRKVEKMSQLRGLLAEIERLADCSPSIISLQQTIVDIIAKTIARYNWVGFYMLDSEDASVLVLGPFHGEPTPHVRIPVTRGICGAAVVLGQTVIVEDVASDPRYLACSVNTKSEIVTPIRVHGLVVGEIDVDSHAPNAFQSEDRKFLEQCAGVVGQYVERFS